MTYYILSKWRHWNIRTENSGSDNMKKENAVNQRFLFFSFLQKYSSGKFVQKIALGFKTRTF